MAIRPQSQRPGTYLITLARDNPTNITLTLDASSIGKCEPDEDALPAGIPTSYTNPTTKKSSPITWLTNIIFKNVAQGHNPNFTLELPVINNSTYIFYNDKTKKLDTLDNKKRVVGGLVTYTLNQNDPSVGMT